VVKRRTCGKTSYLWLKVVLEVKSRTCG